jgi:hypothetical protein
MTPCAPTPSLRTVSRPPDRIVGPLSSSWWIGYDGAIDVGVRGPDIVAAKLLQVRGGAQHAPRQSSRPAATAPAPVRVQLDDVTVTVDDQLAKSWRTIVLAARRPRPASGRS